MNEWISKAANVFKRDVPVTAQPFEVHCECGQKHAGIRRSRHQHLVCKACGVSLFVLPQDSYPPPHLPNTTRPKREKPKGKKLVRKERSTPVDLSLEPVFAPTEEVGRADDLPARRPVRKTQETPSLEQTEELPNVLVRVSRQFGEFVSGFWWEFWHFWTPHRTVAFVILCFLFLTGYYSIQQIRLGEAVKIVKAEYEAGLSEMEVRNWVQARGHLDRASAAVDLLKRDDLEANTIRQYFRETTALTRLSSTSLFDLMEEAEKEYVQSGAEHWTKRFRMKYRDQWSIIEGNLRPARDASAVAQGYDLELIFPLVVGEKQRSVRVELSFELARHLPPLSRGPEPHQPADDIGGLAVFAAQLQECFIDSEGDWVVRMNPKSSFFWVNRPTYEATHLASGSTLGLGEQQQMFESQGKWMGVKP